MSNANGKCWSSWTVTTCTIDGMCATHTITACHSQHPDQHTMHTYYPNTYNLLLVMAIVNLIVWVCSHDSCDWLYQSHRSTAYFQLKLKTITSSVQLDNIFDYSEGHNEWVSAIFGCGQSFVTLALFDAYNHCYWITRQRTDRFAVDGWRWRHHQQLGKANRSNSKLKLHLSLSTSAAASVPTIMWAVRDTNNQLNNKLKQAKLPSQSTTDEQIAIIFAKLKIVRHLPFTERDLLCSASE